MLDDSAPDTPLLVAQLLQLMHRLYQNHGFAANAEVIITYRTERTYSGVITFAQPAL